MSLWVCPDHGLYGGQVFCPKCGGSGEWWDGTFQEVGMIDKELLRQRISFIRQGSETERYHTKRMLQRNDVGHHSFHVAWLAWLMAVALGDEVHPENVVMAALTHDLAEHVTGDLPGDFKREMGLRETFGRYESELFGELGFHFEQALNEKELRVLKLADMMEGAFFCISEASLGNARVGVVFRNFRSYIDKFQPFNEAEEIIVEYIDQLWSHYGVIGAPGWAKTAHKETSMQNDDIIGEPEEQGSGLIETLRNEEAEGRATPRPQSNAPIPGDTGVAKQPADEPVDDVATSDIVKEPTRGPANARQHGGTHYKDVGYEHWDLVLDTGMNYFQGCATKYVTRWRKHDAGEINIDKAIHYVDKVQEADEAGRIKRQNFAYPARLVAEFCSANSLNELEHVIINHIIGWRWDEARRHLEMLRAGYTEPERTNERAYYSQND